MNIRITNGVINLSPDGRQVVRADFCINDSDFVLLAGKNGSGKTSLLDVIAGVRPFDEGNLDLELSSRAIAYAVQDSYSGLVPWRTILQNIILPSLIVDGSSVSTRDRAISLLHIFGLDSRIQDYPYKLSGGEKQVINFIRTVCTPCSLVLFDEVLSSLHHSLRDLAKKELVRWAKERTCILVTHDPDDLNLPYNRYFIIDHDELIEVDRIDVERMLRNVQ